MFLAIVIFLLYFSIVYHEYGHFVEMRRLGVGVAEAGIGMPLGPRISYTPKNGKFSGVRLSFYLLTFFLGAFVKETREGGKKLASLSFVDKAEIFVAGPVKNIYVGCALLILSIFVYAFFHADPSWGWSAWAFYFFRALFVSPYGYLPLGTIVFLLCFKRVFATYLAPIFGAVCATLIAKSLFLGGFGPVVSSVVGPVGFVQVLSEQAVDISSALYVASELSLGLGALNLLPIFPLDGGQLFLPFIERLKIPFLVKAFQYGGLAILLLFLLLVTWRDIVAYVL